jgi:hypothetical protein
VVAFGSASDLLLRNPARSPSGADEVEGGDARQRLKAERQLLGLLRIPVGSISAGVFSRAEMP